MTYSRENHLENLNLEQEHDLDEELISPEAIALIARKKIIFNADSSDDRAFEDCSYLWVETDYKGALSIGQRRAYEQLLDLQQGSLYCLTSIGRLAEAQGIQPSTCWTRLSNLQSLGAIAGFKG